MFLQQVDSVLTNHLHIWCTHYVALRDKQSNKGYILAVNKNELFHVPKKQVNNHLWKGFKLIWYNQQFTIKLLYLNLIWWQQKSQLNSNTKKLGSRKTIVSL